MSNGFTSSLSVINVVGAGLRIYRDRFKIYYPLAFQAYAWVLIPIYGWAKFAAISGMLSRLAYKEVIETPETVTEARNHVNPRMWNFLLAGLLVWLILFGATIGWTIVSVILSIVMGFALQNTPTLAVLFGLILFLVFMVGYLWFYSRLSIVEVPIAIEDIEEVKSALSRSWNLTKGDVVKLQLIYFLAGLISLPVSIFVQILTYIIQAIISSILPTESGIFALINSLQTLIISLGCAAFLIPFWQAIKGVIYYDLCSRKGEFN